MFICTFAPLRYHGLHHVGSLLVSWRPNRVMCRQLKKLDQRVASNDACERFQFHSRVIHHYANETVNGSLQQLWLPFARIYLFVATVSGSSSSRRRSSLSVWSHPCTNLVRIWPSATVAHRLTILGLAQSGVCGYWCRHAISLILFTCDDNSSMMNCHSSQCSSTLVLLSPFSFGYVMPVFG